MLTGRAFGDAVEALASEWRKGILTTDAWRSTSRPGAVQGESEGFFVGCGGHDGYAKPSKAKRDQVPRAAHEKIAADLACDLSLPVPPVLLWERSGVAAGEETKCAISYVPFNPAHKWGHIAAMPATATRLSQALTNAASAMAALDTWLDNRDRAANPGNLIVNGDGIVEPVRYAYIDYSYSMSYGWKDGPVPPVAGVIGPYPPTVKVDISVLAASVQAIESLHADVIKEVVGRIPDAFMTPVRRAVVIDGLLKRRTDLRAALSKTYGKLP